MINDAVKFGDRTRIRLLERAMTKLQAGEGDIRQCKKNV